MVFGAGIFIVTTNCCSDALSLDACVAPGAVQAVITLGMIDRQALAYTR
jgi:hypothetical protein